MIQATCEKVDVVREKIKIAQSKQKSYVDNWRKDIEFRVGKKVFLQVSPTKGLLWFNKKGKLSLTYIGPYEILKRVGQVAYRLALLPSQEGAHNVFHMSMLKKYINNPTHVLSAESERLDADMTYEEQSKEISERKEHNLYNPIVAFVKVRWGNHPPEEASWEREEEMHPQLFRQQDQEPDVTHTSTLWCITPMVDFSEMPPLKTSYIPARCSMHHQMYNSR
ncbi:uncharacterized protein LOC122672225 [Telopea speciosissima]|uniref:uncharacterized protein LOC122672225 n=1 Tax=Telopea speciosissima TaxID=54955 RepID=UPI001CC6E8DB|nr:uncharacterized protein LOC122672225 [Telopea speciosissima]